MARSKVQGVFPFQTRIINGVKCEIGVSAEGEFHSRVGIERARATTLADLLKQLKKLTRRIDVKVAVPASILGRHYKQQPYSRDIWIHGNEVQHVTVYGLDIHGEPKVRDDKTGDKVSLDRRMDLVRRLTAEECATFTRLRIAKNDASEALWTFEQGVKFDVREAVREAIAQKIDTPDEPAEEDDDPR